MTTDTEEPADYPRRHQLRGPRRQLGEAGMKTRHLANKDVPMPIGYEEMMRHYLPANTTKALIVDAWKHNATPAEVLAHLERISTYAESARSHSPLDSF